MEKDPFSMKGSSQNETSSKEKESSNSSSKGFKAPKKDKSKKDLAWNKSIKPSKNLKTESSSSPSSSSSPKEKEGVEVEAKILLDKQLQELQERSEKQTEDLLYLRAEFDNYRRRMVKEKEGLKQLVLESIILRLLEIMDNMDRALSVKVTPENLDTYVQGVQMTSQELRGTLQHFGLEEVETQIGTPFDPTLHEALGSEEHKKIPPGHLSQVYKRAYKFKGKLLRPAQVMVVASPKKEA